MPRFLVECSYEKLFTVNLDVELPENEDDLTEFMEEFENENDIDWTEVKVVFDYSGYEA
jgi:hypothetical protein